MSGASKAGSQEFRRTAQALLAARGINLTKPEVADVCETVFDALRAELMAKRDVGIQGFGAFHVVRRASRPVVNPRLGTVQVPAKFVLKFRPALGLRQELKELPT